MVSKDHKKHIPDFPGMLAEEFPGNRFFPWLAFLVSLVFYWLTVEPAASWWDCPEYLTSAILLEVGHPPGNPFWMLAYRFVASFSTDPHIQTLLVNMTSGLFMALGTGLLCAVSGMALRLAFRRQNASPAGRRVIGWTALAGSLCFGFSDSAWYSAVEAEVYAMSLFLVALQVWLMVKRAFITDYGTRVRYLILTVYLLGLSIGVHELNLLTIPALALIWYFTLSRNHRRRGGLWVTIILSMAAVGIILLFLIPVLISGAGWVELWSVNSIGLPYGSGALLFIFLLMAILWGLPLLTPRRKSLLAVPLWGIPLFITGILSYMLIPIRASANPPLNTGNPSDPFLFYSYFHREQYGSAPLLYGETPFSKKMFRERLEINAAGDTTRRYDDYARKPERMLYAKATLNGRLSSRSGLLSSGERELADSLLHRGDSSRGFYIGYDRRYKLLTTPELDMFFPRIHNSSDLPAYADWTGMDTLNMERVTISEAIDADGNPVQRRDRDGKPIAAFSYRPTYLQHLRLMLGYQFSYMYGRYLMWNFSGRQNDISSTGEVDHGNFLTGIPPLDEAMLGSLSTLPDEAGNGNRGRNIYFMIPLLLGVGGIITLAVGPKVRRREEWVILMLFLMTGIAIVFYLNQSPGEPRERDYSFLGSFWAFSVWISLGMGGMVFLCRRRWLRLAALALSGAAPLWMLIVNYDDHDRSGRHFVPQFATNTLESLPRNAILIVDGDNAVFPMIYTQHVLGVRPDVTVINSAYLSAPWYLDRLQEGGTQRNWAHGSRGVAMTMPRGLTLYGAFSHVAVPVGKGDSIPWADARAALKALYGSHDIYPVLISSRLRFPGSEAVLDLSPEATGEPDKWIPLSRLALLDIILTNQYLPEPRPLYWHSSVPWRGYAGCYRMTAKRLFARRFTPGNNVASTDDGGSESILNDGSSLQAYLTGDSPADPLNFNWGGIESDEGYYFDEITLRNAAQLRREYIQFAEALLKEGKYEEAEATVDYLLRSFPSRHIPWSEVLTTDSLMSEAKTLDRLLRGLERPRPRKAAEILREDSLRRRQWIRYRQSLPPHLRPTLSPQSRALCHF